MRETSLYKLNKKIIDLDDALIASAGEITPALENALSELSLLIEEHTDSIANYVDYLKDCQALIKQRKTELTELQQSYALRLEKFKESVIETMERLGKTKKETPLSLIVIPKRRKVVEIEQENLIPIEYLEHIPEVYKPDIKKIESGLKSGLKIDGAQLVDSKQSIRISKRMVRSRK